MTISSTVRIAGPYIGTGNVFVYPFAFKVFSATDLVVYHVNTTSGVTTTLTQTTHYSVTLNGNQNSTPGGSVTLTAAYGPLATDCELTITSNIANLQPTDLTNQGGFYPEVITDSLDRATIQLQQLSDIGESALRAPLTDGAQIDMTLPSASARANNYLAFDANGEPQLIPVGGGITPTTIARQLFTGDGTTTSFTLNPAPSGIANLCLIYINGVYQQASTYTITGANLVFTVAPPAAPSGAANNIEVVHYLGTVYTGGGGGGGSISNGTYGEITVSGSPPGTVWTINNGVVTPSRLSPGYPYWTPTGPLTVTRANVTNSFLQLNTLDTSASIGPDLSIFRNKTGVANQALGSLTFDGNDNTSVQVEYARLVAYSPVVLAGNANGALSIEIADAGSPTEKARVNAVSTATGLGADQSTLFVSGGLGVTANARIGSSDAASSTSTGALIVTGGVGIGGAAYIGGDVRATAGTASTSTSTGTLVVTGGVGVSGALYANSANVGNLTATGSVSLPSGSITAATLAAAAFPQIEVKEHTSNTTYTFTQPASTTQATARAAATIITGLSTTGFFPRGTPSKLLITYSMYVSAAPTSGSALNPDQQIVFIVERQINNIGSWTEIGSGSSSGNRSYGAFAMTIDAANSFYYGQQLQATVYDTPNTTDNVRYRLKFYTFLSGQDNNGTWLSLNQSLNDYNGASPYDLDTGKSVRLASRVIVQEIL